LNEAAIRPSSRDRGASKDRETEVEDREPRDNIGREGVAGAYEAVATRKWTASHHYHPRLHCRAGNRPETGSPPSSRGPK